MSSDDENGLPPIPRAVLSAVPSTTPFRKRSRGYDSSNSSDAPIFSSDDLAEASLDNYESPRRKRQYRRPWWDEDSSQPIRREHLKRLAKRAKDSGVFMSSDSSSNDDGFGVEHLKTTASKPLESAFNFPKSPKRQQPLQGESLARKVIAHCLEDNNQIVELSNQGLTSLSNDTIKPLRNLIRLPKYQHHPDTEDAYQSFAPQLKLFLSANLLRRVPGELVNLTNLTVLSLRNNQITELPHSLWRLSNLIELNVAGNKLRWLPWELLDLVGKGKLVNLNLLPNPLFQAIPNEQPSGRWHFAKDVEMAKAGIDAISNILQRLDQEGASEAKRMRFSWLLQIEGVLADRMAVLTTKSSPGRSWSEHGMRLSEYYSWKKKPIYLASTPITFFDFDGSVPRFGHPAPSKLSEDVGIVAISPTADIVQPRDCRGNCQSNIPSLFELAVRACGEARVLPELDNYLTEDCPVSVRRMLNLAGEVVDEGGRQCSVCNRSFIVPGAEWIEYWHLGPDSLQFSFEELFFPFLRRSCSWSCAEAAVSARAVSS